MKRLLFAYLLGACAALVAAENAAASNVSTNKASAGVRNPFWPMGYEGERETISPNARPKPKPKDDPAKALPQRPALSRAERDRLAAEKAAAEKAAKELAEKAAREKAEREAAARAEAERKKREITDAHWEAAKKSLAFGGYMKLREADVRERMSIVINGNVYVDGDLISVTHDSRRYTWRIEGLSDKKRLTLARVDAEYLEKPGEAGKKPDKGANP